jgi:hypothetical protein
MDAIKVVSRRSGTNATGQGLSRVAAHVSTALITASA